MKIDTHYLCSDLIRITSDGAEQVGNLEVIAAQGCAVSVPQTIPVGRRVAMQCVECPKGHRVCRECRFSGEVHSVEDAGALGSLLEIAFQHRNWSPQDWQPRHLATSPCLPEEL